jgi:hypothetical protein
MIRDRAAGGALLTFVIATPRFAVPCAPDGTPVATPSGRGILPLLYDPEGVEHEAAACQRVNSARMGNVSTTHFTSSLSPTALLEHYGRQLADSGWRATPISGPGATITRTWTRVDSAGERIAARLTVVVPRDHPECRELELHLDERW